MFTILGLLGLFAAGVAADAILSGRDDAEPEDENDLDQVEDADTARPDMLEELARDDDDRTGIPLSDDIDDPEPEDESLTGGAGDDILSGGGGDDFIEGRDGDDLIDGRGGDDLIAGGAGRDAVWAGAGADTVDGGAGDDSLHGGDGDDSLDGGDGADVLLGQSGDDTMLGAGGADTLIGGLGADLLDGGTGADWLSGGEGDDSLAGGDGSDILDGGAGQDWISGLQGDIDDLDEDFLNGGAGNDTMVLGSGDQAFGDEGEDEFVLHDWLAEGGVAHVSDYVAAQDKLVVVYDPAVHPDPVLTVEAADDGGSSTLLLDGHPLVVVRGDAINLDDVELKAV